MKTILITLLLLTSVYSSEIALTGDTANENGKKTNILGTKIKIEDNITVGYSDELSIDRYFKEIDSKDYSNYIKSKNILFCDIDEQNKIYFKIKYFRDYIKYPITVEKITYQDIIVIGHNYKTYINKQTEFSTKFGVGKMNETDLNTNILDVGFRIKYSVTKDLGTKINYERLFMKDGFSEEYSIENDYNFYKQYSLSLDYTSTYNKNDISENSIKHTNLFIKYKF